MYQNLVGFDIIFLYAVSLFVIYTLANWNSYIVWLETNASASNAQVGTTTLASTMARWPIPDQFRDQAVQSVNLLVLAAMEGSYTTQGFIFDTQSGASLSTLLVATQKLDTPNDPNSPVAISYMTITTNVGIKQQYTAYNVRSCHTCPKCAWLWKCCCHDNTEYSPRGNTLEELEIIKNKMKFDQYDRFNRAPFNKMIEYRALPQRNNLTEALENFLSNTAVKAEILAPYNDSVLSTLQSSIGSLRLSSQSLKLTKVNRKNVFIILSALAKDYGFENDYLNSQFTQQLQTGRASYENLFTAPIDNNHVSIKYIWILGQTLDNSTYSINFLSVNITSQILIDTLLSNGTNTNETNQQIKIVRTSTLNDRGEFFDEHLLTLITPWQLETTKTALNILRFTAASALIPQKHRMLSYFNSVPNNVPESRSISEKIIALSKAVSAVAGAWKDVVTALKSSSSTTITRIVRFGFTHFSQKSSVLKVMNIPADRATQFINALIIDYNIPPEGSFALALTYSDDFDWTPSEFLYSPERNGNYRSLTLFKNGDSLSNTASFFIVDINADWQLAPDLLLIQKSKSILGGLFESNKQSIQEIPHSLTLDEVTKLQQFFMLVAMGNLASTLHLNVTLPELN
jgi:hypothetical protein